MAYADSRLRGLKRQLLHFAWWHEPMNIES